MVDQLDPMEQDRIFRELVEKGHSDVYARAYAKKAHEGDMFAEQFALIRERRAKREGLLKSPASSTQQSTRKRKPDDFIISKRLGVGAYSTVFLCTEKETQREFAIKILEKSLLQKERKEKTVITERDVFNKLKSPFVVSLYYTFQDSTRLYFVIEFCKNGELLEWIQKLGSFDEDCTRFYVAEIILALEHMHEKGVIHRDLKPENILLDNEMHIKLTDFGTAKIFDTEEPDAPHSSGSFVGTAQYVSPELLGEKSVGKSSDLWALGCIIYQLLSGKVPFRASNDFQTFRLIQNLEFDYPPGFPEDAKDLVSKLLVANPKERLGCPEMGGYQKLKEHPFFKSIHWDSLAQQQPPKLEAYLPSLIIGEKGIHAGDAEEDDELARIEADLYRKQMGIITLPEEDKEKKEKLARQERENPWHGFLNKGELVVKMGLVDKRRGLFSKRRVLILTDTPRLIYIDPDAKELKGEIPWGDSLRPQYKNMRTFFVHTPNRTYYLEDVEKKSIAWVDTINQVLKVQQSKRA